MRKTNALKILVRKVLEKRPLESLRVGGRIILKWVLQK
jgi:hypothetical protein